MNGSEGLATHAPRSPAPSSADTAAILREIQDLKRLITPAQDISATVLDDYRRQFSEAMKLKSEMDEIQAAIMQTKREIATLHVSNFEGREMSRVTDELDAVVNGTEMATESILSAAEAIDDAANTLSARTKGQDHALAADIQERVVGIFEACNFQDLTGQRITKVVNALRFVEDRVNRMIEIWGGMEGFSEIEAEEMAKREGDAALLNGPALDHVDEDIASQDDIDALFA